MKVAIIAEYYPRAADPTLGIWAHHQARAARDAGADVRVIVLHRPVPPLAAVRGLRSGSVRGTVGAARAATSQPATATLDGISIQYLRYLSPPRGRTYATWGAWAAPLLGRALRRMRVEFPFDLVHAHYAVPAGDAVRRAAPDLPLVVSVHGGDVLGAHAEAPTVSATFAHARLVLANSAGTARRCYDRGARDVQVVHLGADPPAAPAPPPATPTLVTVANLIERKRIADVIRAVALLTGEWPELRHVIVGDGSERGALEALATALGVADRVTFLGRLAPEDAVASGRRASLFVLPSTDEAFGVAYVEAMAAGVPAIGCRGEDGPEEIAAAGGGITLVAPRDPPALASAVNALLSDSALLGRLRARARETVLGAFTWERCGRQTVAAYEEILRA
ncbi:MAG: glycosyltransferase family 4 protein [Solirubrobacteraceae bacterium]